MVGVDRVCSLWLGWLGTHWEGGWLVGWGRTKITIVGRKVVEVKGAKLEVEVEGAQLLIVGTKEVEAEMLEVVSLGVVSLEVVVMGRTLMMMVLEMVVVVMGKIPMVVVMKMVLMEVKMLEVAYQRAMDNLKFSC